MTPEKLHLAVNHVPMIALAALLLPMVYALLAKQKVLLVLLLAMTCVLGAATIILMQSGENAEHRMEDGELAGPPYTEQIHDLIEEHEERAEVTAISSYATALLAAIAIALAFYRLEWSVWVSWVVVVGMVVTTALAMWTSQAGGLIRHPELRATSTAG